MLMTTDLKSVVKNKETYEIFPDGSEKDISDEMLFDIPDSWECAFPFAPEEDALIFHRKRVDSPWGD